MPPFFLNAFVFCLGAIIGSFLNVCIYRMPRRESIIRPRSHCPQCKAAIAWYDNIPFLSYLFLKGRCRHCKSGISPRYFVVESLSAGMFLFFWQHFGLSSFFFIYSALGASLIVVSFIDIAIQEIPDEISLPGIVIGLILSLGFPQLHLSLSPGAGLWNSALGLLAGGGAIYITGLLGNAVFKKESMGGGDVKLMAMIGAFIGWKLALLTFFLAPFFGAAVGIVIKIREGKSLIPYGPFLSLACFISIVWGQRIINWLFYP